MPKPSGNLTKYPQHKYETQTIVYVYLKNIEIKAKQICEQQKGNKK